MTIRYPDQIDPNQRAILWLAMRYGSVGVRPAHKFMWRNAAGSVSIGCVPTQMETLERRGLGLMRDGVFILTEAGQMRASRMMKAPQRVVEAHVESTPFALTEAQMRAVRPWFPAHNAGQRSDDAKRLSGIIHALRSGVSFSQLPPGYARPLAISRRFTRWARSGVLDEVLSRVLDERGRLLIDADMIWRHRQAAHYAAQGCFPILAPADDRIAA